MRAPLFEPPELFGAAIRGVTGVLSGRWPSRCQPVLISGH